MKPIDAGFYSGRGEVALIIEIFETIALSFRFHTNEIRIGAGFQKLPCLCPNAIYAFWIGFLPFSINLSIHRSGVMEGFDV